MPRMVLMRPVLVFGPGFIGVGPQGTGEGMDGG